MEKALKRHGKPEAITIDGLRSYGAAMMELDNADKQEVGVTGHCSSGTSLIGVVRRVLSV